MTKYIVRKLDTRNIKTIDEYNNLYNNAPIKYCLGLKNVELYCGGKLHKERCGYSGIINGIEYIAEKC